VAERRRAKAREQLDAKLAAMAAADSEQWDDDADHATGGGGALSPGKQPGGSP